MKKILLVALLCAMASGLKAQNTFPYPSSGSLGIGTTSPTAQLHIFGSGQNTANLLTIGALGGTLFLQDSNGGPGNGGAVLFGAAFGPFASIKGLVQDGHGYSLGDLSFATRDQVSNSSLTERMRITFAGNIGIGTPFPNEKLFVNGAIGVAGSTTGYPYNVNTGVFDFSAGYSRLLSFGANPSTRGGFQFYQAGSTNVNANVAMLIDPNSNVGIGTPSPGSRLEVNGGVTIRSNTASPLSFLASGYGSEIDAVYNEGRLDIFKAGIGNAPDRSAVATFDLYHGYGDHTPAADGFLFKYRNLDAGGLAAGTNNTLMFLRGDGKVGIGTTAPTQKLDVTGGAIGVSNSGSNSNAVISTSNGNYLSIEAFNSGNAIKYPVMINPYGGNVGIGTTDTHGYKLAVNGDIHTQKVIVDLINWPDYVFKPTYNLKPLSEVKTYIDLNHHLPEMPSEKEVSKKGIDLGEMNKLLAKKVEELTLYLIEEHKQKQIQDDRVNKLEAIVAKLSKDK